MALDGSAPAGRLPRLRPPVALALGGGGARGAAQAGVVIELVRAGLRPDLVVGTSIGAWNGAWVAGHPDVAGVEELTGWWSSAEVRRILRGMWLGYAGAIAWRRTAALSAERIERLLRAGFGDTVIEDLEIPLAVGAADLLSADMVYFDRGAVATAVRASSAIPTVLPPVPVEDRLLVDGGVLDNFGVHEAVRRGARSIVLVDISVAEVVRPPVGLGEIIDRAALISQVHQRRRSMAAAAGAGVPLHLIEVGRPGSPYDFDQAAASLEHGRRVALAWLAGDPLPVPAPPAEEERRRLLSRWRQLDRIRSHVGAGPLGRLMGQYGNGSAAAADAGEPAADGDGAPPPARRLRSGARMRHETRAPERSP